MSTIAEFESELNGGQRANRYKISFSLPTGVSGDIRSLSLLGKSTTLPGKESGQIELKRDGKTIRVKGDTTSTATFNVTFQIPKKSKEFIKTFYEWNDLEEDYKTTMSVNLLDLTNTAVATQTITGVWVSSIPGLALDQDSSDTILEFDVTFSCDETDVNAAGSVGIDLDSFSS